MDGWINGWWRGCWSGLDWLYRVVDETAALAFWTTAQDAWTRKDAMDTGYNI